jgi:predicted porin
MKKTLLAAALLAGFAGAAHAQSNVTLYGIIDGGLDFKSYDGKHTSAIDSGVDSQSRFGIRGSEDLGNGLKAVFDLENGFNVDDGTQLQNRLFGRAAWVGLDSETAGRLAFGRTPNLGYAWASNIVSPFGLSYGIAQLGTTFGYQDNDLGGGRSDNTVYYYSPVIAGFQGAVGVSTAIGNGTNTVTDEVAGFKNNNRLVDAGLKYDRGPLKAVVTYQYVAFDDTQPNNGNMRNLTVGGNYDFGIAALFLGYGQVNNIRDPGYNSIAGLNASPGSINTGFVTADRNDDKSFTVGTTVPIGNGKVYGAYARATSSDLGVWALGYTYDLSKRTNLYVFYADATDHSFTEDRNLIARQVAMGLVTRF